VVPEFRQRAVALARAAPHQLPGLAKDLGISRRACGTTRAEADADANGDANGDANELSAADEE
jgi:hypothetical protein